MKNKGRLSFIKDTGIRKNGCIVGLFHCECGNTSSHVLYRVMNGEIKSCGCGRKKKDSEIKKSYHDYKYRAKLKKMDFGITFDIFKMYVIAPCFYCNAVPKSYHGVDRIHSDLGYIDGNLVACCRICNIMKNTLHPEDFKDHIIKIYKTMFDRAVK